MINCKIFFREIHIFSFGMFVFFIINSYSTIVRSRPDSAQTIHFPTSKNEPSDRRGPWLSRVLFLFRNFTYFMEREEIESEQSTHRRASARFPLGTRARTRTDCVPWYYFYYICNIYIFLYILRSRFVRRCRVFEFLGVCRGSTLPFYIKTRNLYVKSCTIR